MVFSPGCISEYRQIGENVGLLRCQIQRLLDYQVILSLVYYGNCSQNAVRLERMLDY